MLSSLALIEGEEGGKRGRNPTGTALDILIVGLGGGALPMYIKKHLPMVRNFKKRVCNYSKYYV